jgi:hypothetical protein
MMKFYFMHLSCRCSCGVDDIEKVNEMSKINEAKTVVRSVAFLIILTD